MISKLRWLFLVFGLISLGYIGWIWFDARLQIAAETKAFEDARREAAGAAGAPAPASHEAPGDFRAKLTIPRLALTTIVRNGDDDRVLRYAAGHIPSTAFPGEKGNVALAAHRDTIFRGLREIQPGDHVLLQTERSDYEYIVDRTSIVNPTDVSVLNPTPGVNTLTLVTCYPFYYVGHAPKRFIVRAHEVTTAAADRRAPARRKRQGLIRRASLP
jgi:sortase A